jgi:hypothetical protein
MDIVKRQDCWKRFGTDELWEQKDRSKVMPHEFRDSADTLGLAMGEGLRPYIIFKFQMEYQAAIYFPQQLFP